MYEEWTVGDVYEEIAERLALAQTRALMGEREAALCALRSADLEFRRWRSALESYPGYHTLKYSLDTALEALSEQAALCDETDDGAPADLRAVPNGDIERQAA